MPKCTTIEFDSQAAPEAQAEIILNDARKAIQEEKTQKVGVVFSANTAQAKSIQEHYDANPKADEAKVKLLEIRKPERGECVDQMQTRVMQHLMHTLSKDENADLAKRIVILPLPTMTPKGLDAEEEQVCAGLNKIEAFTKEKGHITLLRSDENCTRAAPFATTNFTNVNTAEEGVSKGNAYRINQSLQDLQRLGKAQSQARSSENRLFRSSKLGDSDTLQEEDGHESNPGAPRKDGGSKCAIM